MEFCVLTEEEFRKFSEKHPQESFFQTVETAKLRESFGSIIHYLGVKKGNEIIAGGMFTETDCLFGKKRFYAPQGFLIDYHDYDLLDFYTKNLALYFKKHKGMFFKMEPNVVYRYRNGDGEKYDPDLVDDLTINNLKKVGYKHFGFTNDFRFTLSRWNFRVALDKDYEELKKGFSKSTRKNIETSYKKGVSVRKSSIDDIEQLALMFQATADRRHFTTRNSDYYRRMHKYLKDLMQFYIAHVDFNKYYEYINSLLEEELANNKSIKEKMLTDMVGSKLKNNLESSNKRLIRLNNDLEHAKELLLKYPNGKDIGGLLSLKSGCEYVTLTSGTLSEFREFMPKYVMYNEHILDAYRFGMKYVNFFGISGNFDPKNPLYGVYEFKRGFNGQVIEMVGEFTYKLSNTYYIYNALRHLKILLRNITKR